MIMKLPIQFDSSIQINYQDGSFENSLVFPTQRGRIPCTFSKMNGFDANNKRVTNLVGYDGSELLKLCPNCSKVKPVIEFGYSGRTIRIKRDQSHCSECRGTY